jgi:hypothetical protein
VVSHLGGMGSVPDIPYGIPGGEISTVIGFSLRA